MQPKIAVITTPYLKSFVQQTLSQFSFDNGFEVYTYRRFQEIPPLYRSIPEEITGVLTSGIFPAQVIWLSFPETNRVIVPFNTDDAALYRLFLKLLDQNRALDFSRVYADVVQRFHIDLHTYLLGELDRPLSTSMNQAVGKMTLEELYRVEEEEMGRHLSLWRSGKVDLCVSRFSSIIPPLRAQGVRVYFPFPSQEYLRTTCRQLFQELELRQLQKNQSAAVSLSLPLPPQGLGDALFERRCLALQAALLELMGDSPLDYSLNRSRFGFELLTSRKTVSHLTCGGSCCKLRQSLAQRLDFPVCVGYGIGRDLYQARINAQNANRESELHPEQGSFLVDEEERLIGPLGDRPPIVVPSSLEQGCEGSAKRCGLSPLTVQRVLAALGEMPDRRLTARELALKLSITQRSANRFLTAMEKAGLLTIIGERRVTTKGRPERVYVHRQEA